MKICVTSQGDNLEAQVDPRFGRCQYFIFVDTDTLDFEAVPNPNLSGMGGVGVQSGQLVVEKKAKAVLTGKVGPKALQVLQVAGIEMFMGMPGSIRLAVEQYKEGGLTSSSDPNAGEKSGLNG